MPWNVGNQAVSVSVALIAGTGARPVGQGRQARPGSALRRCSEVLWSVRRTRRGRAFAARARRAPPKTWASPAERASFATACAVGKSYLW